MHYQEGRILHQRQETRLLINNAQHCCNLNDFASMRCQWHYQLMPTSVVIFRLHLAKTPCFVEQNNTLTTTSSRFKITCCTLKIVCIFRKGHSDSACFSLATTFLQRDILALTRHWSLFLEIFGGHKCRRPSKTLYYLAIHVQGQRILGIDLMGSCNHCRFPNGRGHLFRWTSSQICRHQLLLTPSML